MGEAIESFKNRIWGSFDSLMGNVASGWAWNPNNPDVPPIIDFYCNGQLVGSAAAVGYREDVRDAGFGSGYAAFFVSLDLPKLDTPESIVHAYVREGGVELASSPRRSFLAGHFKKWLNRKDRATPDVVRRLKTRLNTKTSGLHLSIIMPMYNSNYKWLAEAIESVKKQWCDRWELVCVDDGSDNFDIAQLVKRYSFEDPRIILIQMPRNRGVAAATNIGIATASGTHVAFLDHDDYLEPDAVYHLLNAARSGADLIYSDELITGEDISTIIGVAVRPAFSHDYYLSHPYFVHMVAVKTEIARKVGGWNEMLSVSGDVDFILRTIECSEIVAHVPAVIYRWRTHSRSTGHQRQSQVMAATQKSISAHLARRGVEATVRAGPSFNSFRIDYADDAGKTLIIIPTKNRVDLLRACIESVESTLQPDEFRICVINHESDDPATVKYLNSLRFRHQICGYNGEFNYSRMNNIAVHRYGNGFKYLLFMNNDVETIEDGWLKRMRSLAARTDVGVVGSTLLYGDGRIQHSGVIIGIRGVADHAHKFRDFLLDKKRRNEGYMSSLVSLREYSAVTAACMMVRSDTFKLLGGFDEKFAIAFNDTDFCLRVLAKGLKILNDGHTVLFHYESATRSRTGYSTHPGDDHLFSTKWQKLIEDGDCFYSPFMTLSGADHELNNDGFKRRNVGMPRIVKISN